jgi:hypothetical protein
MGGEVPIAPAPGQAVDIGAPITVRVTVRDLGGTPLGGATVHAVVDGSATGSAVRTDATGLATLTTAYRTSLAVRAELSGFDAATSAVAGTAAEVFVTIRLRRPFALAHPYAWQNRVMRERLYREHPEDRDDPGTAPTPGADDRKDRTERLLQIVTYLGGALGIAAPTASAAAVDAERARLQRVGERLDALSTREGETTGREGLDDAGEQELASSRAEVGLADPRPAPRAPSGSHARTPARTDRMDRQPELNAIREARRLVDGRLGRVNELALSHRELLDHLVNRIFPAAPPGAIAGWVKYMMIHFTGLRYVNSNASYCLPQTILSRLRAQEIDAGELASASAERLRVHVGEVRAIVAALGASPPRAIRTAMAFVDRYDPAHAGAAAPRARSGEPADLTQALVAVYKLLDERWASSMTDNEVYALLRLRSEASPLAPSAGHLGPSGWTWIQTHTTLRNDLTRWDESASPSHGLTAGTGEWSTRQGVDLTPTPWGAECNQIAEMAAHSRGFSLRGGISWDATFDGFAPRSADGLSTDGGPLIGNLKTRATSVGTDPHTIWRPASAAELSQGDLFFKMMWIPLYETRDRTANRVFPTLDMEFAVGRAYTANDDVPRVQATRTPARTPGHDRVRSTITAGYPTGDLQVLDMSTLPEVDESRLSQPVAAGEFEPTSDGHGFVPIDRPLPAPEGDAGSLYAKCGERVVRRHPSSSVYHEVLVWYHIGTVIATDANRVYTFETAAPTGMKRWGFDGLLGSWAPEPTERNPRPDATYTVFGRAANQADHAAVAGHINPSILFSPYLED